jgi:hypothetical protein
VWNKKAMRNDKVVMMIQPGAFGDIIICAPIAEAYHSAGYRVVWPVRQKFMKMIEPLLYVEPYLLDDEELDPDWLRSDVIKCLRLLDKNPTWMCLNLADRGPHATEEQPWENFEQCKYRLSNIPFRQKHVFNWERNLTKENYIYRRFVSEVIDGRPEKYALVHNTSSHGEASTIPDISLPIVKCEDFDPSYGIYDWYQVIVLASEIYVTESSIWAFCDSLANEITKERYLLPRANMSGMTTVSSTWKRDYLK